MRSIVPIFMLAATVSVSSTVLAQSLLDPQSSEIHATTDLSSNSAVTAVMSPVTGEPYEASKVTRSVWKLGDGTTIKHEAETKIARDGEGRVREDIEQTHATSIGGKQTNSTTESVMVADPVDHSLTSWTGKSKIAVRMEMPDFSALTKKPLPGGVMGGIMSAPPPPPPPGSGPRSVSLGLPSSGGGLARGVPAAGSDQVRTEDLGKQSIAGVLATGKRTTTVIATGKIGNDQPITIVHEEWYSPDLKVVVKSVDSDPRSGERTMELEGVTRGDPDPALFHAPEGYTVKDLAGALKSVSSIGRSTPDK